MKIEEIIEITRNKVRNLVFMRGEAAKTGDLAAVAKFDIEIEETQTTLQKLEQAV